MDPVTPVAGSLAAIIADFKEFATTGLLGVGNSLVTFITSQPLAMLGVYAWCAIVGFGVILRLIKN